jgi:hypothetical protein
LQAQVFAAGMFFTAYTADAFRSRLRLWKPPLRDKELPDELPLCTTDFVITTDKEMEDVAMVYSQMSRNTRNRFIWA